MFVEQIDIRDRDDNKEVSLTTSKINYMDPRVSVAWCKRHEVPVEKARERENQTCLLLVVTAGSCRGASKVFFTAALIFLSFLSGALLTLRMFLFFFTLQYMYPLLLRRVC